MSIFYSDTSDSLEVSWEQLIEDINSIKKYNPYCYVKDFYSVFKQIVLSLIYDEAITLLDTDFSDQEVEKLTDHLDFSEFQKDIEAVVLSDKNDLINRINSKKNNWSITLYTSGTTGLPKKVKHTFSSITRFVKISEHKAKNIWGFAYNPTHMAGIQVFFQALLNGNSIVRLFGLTPDTIFREIKENNITHISATPTFYRLLLPWNERYNSVVRITSGGEKFDSKTLNQMKQIFPKARFTNVYASTEAGTLFAADGDAFTLKENINGLIKIIDGELIIHKELMGNMDIETGEWYHTGDLVDLLSENPIRFRFLSRKNEMINVGGYKVNPGEVEEIIREIDGIKEVRVYSKSNSVLGNIICAEIVCTDKALNETEIRNTLQQQLQEFKIPRIIRFVDEILTTRTGKIKRN